MAEVVEIPTRGIPTQVTAREMYAQPEPTDRQVWAACRYVQFGKHEKCRGCPAWEPSRIRDIDVVKRGCRALAEECVKVVFAASPNLATPSPNIRHDPGLEAGETGE